MSVSASPSRTVNRRPSCQAVPPQSTTVSVGRLFGRTLAALACVTGLSACATLAPAPVPLPDLNEAAALRDQVARHEAASVERATELAAKASACGDCHSVATGLAQGATQRLETIGGLWDPWPADAPQSLVEQPTPVAEAPLSPAAFAQWLEATARHDMTHALIAHRGSPEVVTTEHAVPVLTLATARAIEAWDLAQVYGVDLNADAPQLGALLERASQMAQGAEGSVHTQWVLTPKDLSPTSSSDPEAFDKALREALSESSQAAQAVRTWDCVAQTLPHLDIAVEPLSNARQYADALLTRSTDMLAKGASDERQLRCELEASTASQLAQQVLAADLAVALSPSPEVSALGVELLLTDANQWRGVISSSDVLSLLSQ